MFSQSADMPSAWLVKLFDILTWHVSIKHFWFWINHGIGIRKYQHLTQHHEAIVEKLVWLYDRPTYTIQILHIYMHNKNAVLVFYDLDYTQDWRASGKCPPRNFDFSNNFTRGGGGDVGNPWKYLPMKCPFPSTGSPRVTETIMVLWWKKRDIYDLSIFHNLN